LILTERFGQGSKMTKYPYDRENKIPSSVGGSRVSDGTILLLERESGASTRCNLRQRVAHKKGLLPWETPEGGGKVSMAGRAGWGGTSSHPKLKKK